MFEDRLDDVGVIVDTKLIGDGQKQRVGQCDGFIVPELLNEDVRLGGVAAAKNGSGVVTKEADGVIVLVPAAEIGAVAVVHERKDAAADRHPRDRPPSTPHEISGSAQPAGRGTDVRSRHF
jgi:hypothetical protein